MAICSDCRVELPREEMFGTEGDLRCPKCAANRRNRYHAPRARFAVERAAVTIAVMVLAGVVTLSQSKAPAVSKALTDSGEAVWRGEIWRFFTTIFPHGGVLHLGFNLYWMWMFGRVIETWMGSLRYAAFLFLAAFGSMSASFLVEGPAIGLSGVVFAYIGLLFALRKRKDFAAALMQPQMVQQLVIWFILCIGITSSGLMGIGNGAHAAGALIGWLTGVSVLQRQRIPGLVGVVVLTIASVGATQYMPWDPQYAFFRYRESVRLDQPQQAQFWLEKAMQNGGLVEDEEMDVDPRNVRRMRRPAGPGP
jgi:membrane associated rhomboid family serine protease